MDMTTGQAVSVYGDLVSAYYGDNSFGSDTAEIYAYRMQTCRPSLLLDKSTETFRKADKEAALQAGENLLWIIREFKKNFNARVELDGMTVSTLRSEGLWHRVQVKVTRGLER